MARVHLFRKIRIDDDEFRKTCEYSVCLPSSRSSRSSRSFCTFYVRQRGVVLKGPLYIIHTLFLGEGVKADCQCCRYFHPMPSSYLDEEEEIGSLMSRVATPPRTHPFNATSSTE